MNSNNTPNIKHYHYSVHYYDTALKMNIESVSDLLALKSFTVYELAVDQKPLYLSIIFYADRCKHTNSFISMHAVASGSSKTRWTGILQHRRCPLLAKTYLTAQTSPHTSESLWSAMSLSTAVTKHFLELCWMIGVNFVPDINLARNQVHRIIPCHIYWKFIFLQIWNPYSCEALKLRCWLESRLSWLPIKAAWLKIPHTHPHSVIFLRVNLMTQLVVIHLY